ncbi:MAG: division/cell wall cluster transcriptional repressor MraZ [Anaerolineales bacterium]|nr:division/cell wall cluster transcriptional repressor MraZ [Anaerolineales bacterium]
MFLGQYLHSFDDKGRLTVPARFRDSLAEGAVVVQGLDQNLMVLTQAAFEVVYQRLMAMNLTDPAARALRRLILGTAFPLELDSAGRILIPQNLRSLVGLESEAMLVGQGDYFEVWAPVPWKDQETELHDPAVNAQRFATLDLSTR